MERLQTSLIERTLRKGAIPLFAGFACFLLGAITLHFTVKNVTIAPVWPANALLLAVILMRPREDMLRILAAGMVATALTSISSGTPMPLPLFYACATGLEVGIAAMGLRLSNDARRVFSDPDAVPEVLLWVGLLAPLASAWIGGAVASYRYGHSFAEAYARCFLADSLGLLIFTPLFVALLSGDLFRSVATLGARKRIEFAGLLAITAIIAALILFRAESAFLFLMVPPMMFVVLRTGWMGTKVALAIVTVIGGAATISGHGPIELQGKASLLQVYGIQIFIAAMIIIQLPIAAALTARQNLIDRLRESEQSLRMLASRSPILLLAFDLTGRCERVVGSTEPMLDKPSTTLVGASFADVSAEGQFELQRAHNAALDDVTISHTAEFRTTKLRDAWLDAVFCAHFDDMGRCVGTIATVHDVTMRKNQELSLSITAKTDGLTGVLNRSGFRDQLDHALLNATPGSLSLAVIDIDRFKLVNDNSGHQIGDVVLREVARRIASQVRASDAVGRLGGDEFVILLATSNWERVQEICRRIVTAVNEEPVILPSGNSLRTAISCGVARYRDGLDVEAFLHEADTALYQAKRAGRNRVVAA